MTKAAPATTAPLPADIAKLSFEEALAELEKLVRQLEDGKAKLDDAIAAYERGALFETPLRNQTARSAGRIEQIAVGADGTVTPSRLTLNP